MSLQETLKPKSDQLNADDPILLSGPITLAVTGYRQTSDDQPFVIELQGVKPFKPCLTMRRVLFAAWGNESPEWVGRGMTLYRDPEPTFEGKKVGGVRISHLSHIAGEMSISVTVRRGKKGVWKVKPLQWPPPQHPAPVDLPTLIGVPADILVGYLNSLPNGSFACHSLADLTPAQVARIAADPAKIRGLVNAWADSQETQQ